MKKIGIGILVAAVVLSFSGIVSAQKLIPAAKIAREKSKADNSPVITKAVDGDLALSTPGLEKIIFIHYKKGFVKPPWAGGGKKEKETKCYGFLGRGVEWKDLLIDYVIDPDNPDGLSVDFVETAISAGAEEWDSWTGADLFGTYTIDHDASWDGDAPDGRNELVFEDYPKDGVIGVAVVWGYFSGPPSMREIIEFDILFDTDYAWGDATINSGVMDLQNIATHELGHGVGLADLYDTVCAEETMYGYSVEGEIKKRDLNTGDITGIQTLYGN